MTLKAASLEAANRKTTHKMKLVMFVMTLLLAVSAIFAFRSSVQRPGPGYPIPTFPGHGPFNPRPRLPPIPHGY